MRPTLLIVFAGLLATASAFRIGAGIADVTGPTAEIGFMGYAMSNQTGTGLHTRQYARAVVIGDGDKVVAVVSSDLCMMMHGLKQGVVTTLQQKLGDVFTYDNVLLSGTHTHGGTGGYGWNVLYLFTTLGYHEDVYDATVAGLAQAILNAYAQYQKSSDNSNILINSGSIKDMANINRSPTSYLANPASERAQYPDGDTDKLMTLLRMVTADGKDIASFNWFAVHGTSMTNTNTLVSSDNKGYASYLMEQYINGPEVRTGTGPFVAAFAQSNMGDVSPNIKGTFCPDGTPCDSVHSTCGGKNEGCHGYGPGADEFQSTAIIGQRQFETAVELFKGANETLDAVVDYRHMWVDMENVQVSGKYTATGQNATTCTAAMGDSFAAGTTDGPGEFDFTQGSNSTKDNPFWNALEYLIVQPTQEMWDCHAPKPILLATGLASKPVSWTARYQPVQIIRIGRLYLLAVPGEFTTMAGRRLRNSVAAALKAEGVQNPVVVIAAISNSYGGYITTYEEYQYQRYEAASTIYGPHELAAYQQLFSQLATAIATNQTLPPGPFPPDQHKSLFCLQPGVLFDTAPLFKNFGDVSVDVQASYQRGSTAQAVFWGANPRTDFWMVSSYATVERFDTTTNEWTVYRTDADWETKFHWRRSGVSDSLVTTEWNIPMSTPPGTYRLKTFGRYKPLIGSNGNYEGTSASFQVI